MGTSKNEVFNLSFASSLSCLGPQIAKVTSGTIMKAKKTDDPNLSSKEGQIALAKILLLNWKRNGAVVCTVLGVVITTVAGRVSSSNCPPAQQTISRAEYEQLETGMTVTDAQATIGRAVEVSRKQASATYEWRNCDGSKISATFDKGVLVSKEQFGLK